MNRPTAPVKRRNVFSNPKAQRPIILTFVSIALVSAATSWYVSMTSLDATAKQIGELDLSPSQQHDVGVIVRDQETTLKLQLTVQTVAAFLLLTLASVFISHHIGGPLHQLMTYLRGMVDGTVAPRRIRFRRHDFFDDLPETFNTFQTTFGILKDETVHEDER